MHFETRGRVSPIKVLCIRYGARGMEFRKRERGGEREREREGEGEREGAITIIVAGDLVKVAAENVSTDRLLFIGSQSGL